MGKYMQHKSKIQHGEVTGKVTSGNTSKILQGTSVTQPSEGIEVEDSTQFSFGVKATDNTIIKENHSHTGIQDNSNDQGKDVNILKQH